MKHLAELLAGFGAVCAIAGCAVESDGTGAVSVGDPAVTSSVSVTLPFDSPFPDRTNASNDGSSFEPCVSYTDDDLRRFEIDPDVVSDAAIVNGQGIRGCIWDMVDRFAISVVVTNSASLEQYRAGAGEYRWLPDLRVNGRVVGYFELDHVYSKACLTYVQSGGAGVVTNVVSDSTGDAPGIDPCQLVEGFTRAFIDKIPK